MSLFSLFITSRYTTISLVWELPDDLFETRHKAEYADSYVEYLEQESEQILQG